MKTVLLNMSFGVVVEVPDHINENALTYCWDVSDDGQIIFYENDTLESAMFKSHRFELVDDMVVEVTHNKEEV
jgi:hypothetical protein